MIVAIDGPAGAGKSTVARRLAERLGFRYLDTGAMYRALTWLALERGVDARATATRSRALAQRAPGRRSTRRPRARSPDATSPTRSASPRIDRPCPPSRASSRCARSCASASASSREQGDAVIEGRDIGTVVAPDAEVKVYLVADEAERARRRLAERPGIGADALATDLRLRDESDAAADAAGRRRRADRHDRARGRRGRRAHRAPRPRAAAGMSRVDAVWAVGRAHAPAARRASSRALRVYGAERVPREGGVVLAFNHFHWIDPPAFGAATPRTRLLHGEDRGAPRPRPRAADPRRSARSRSGAASPTATPSASCARSSRDGDALGLFVEGTRQRSGVPGRGAAGRGDGRAPGGRAGRSRRDPRLAALAARQLPAGLGRVGRADALRRPRRATGAATARRPREIEREIRRLWECLVEMHARAAGPRRATPPS